MADETQKGLKDIATLLVATNKKLDTLNAGAAADSTVEGYIKQALPEILSDRVIQSRSEKFDKREGVTEVDEAVKESTKAIKKVGSDAIEDRVEKKRADKAGQKAVTEGIANAELDAAKDRAKGRDDAAGYTVKLADGFKNVGEESLVARRQQINDEKIVNEERARKIEEQGGIAKENAKYVKESYDIQKAEFALRKKNPELTGSARREINREAAQAAKENRKTGGLMRRMAGSVIDSAKKTGRTATMGLFGILSILGLGGFLIALGAFLKSKYWEMTVDWIKGTLIPNLKKFYGWLKKIGKYFLTDILPGLCKFYEWLVGDDTKGWKKVLTGLALIVSTYSMFKVLSWVTRLGSLIGAVLGLIPMAGRALAGIFFKSGMAPGATTSGKLGKLKVIQDAKGQWRYAAGTPISKGVTPGGFVSTENIGKIKGQRVVGMGAGSKIAKFLDDFPLLKKLAKRLPFIGAILTSYLGYNIIDNDKTTTADKAVALGRLVGGMAGSLGGMAIGAALGAAFGGVGAIPGGIAGLIGGGFFGEELGATLMKWLMGIEDPKPVKPPAPPTAQLPVPPSMQSTIGPAIPAGRKDDYLAYRKAAKKAGDEVMKSREWWKTHPDNPANKKKVSPLPDIDIDAIMPNMPSYKQRSLDGMWKRAPKADRDAYRTKEKYLEQLLGKEGTDWKKISFSGPENRDLGRSAFNQSGQITNVFNNVQSKDDHSNMTMTGSNPIVNTKYSRLNRAIA
jgi:hypothetical protein